VFAIQKPVNVNVEHTSSAGRVIAASAGSGTSTPKKDVRSVRATLMEAKIIHVIHTLVNVHVSRASRA
jgi:hypothetical protein